MCIAVLTYAILHGMIVLTILEVYFTIHWLELLTADKPFNIKL